MLDFKSFIKEDVTKAWGFKPTESIVTENLMRILLNSGQDPLTFSYFSRFVHLPLQKKTYEKLTALSQKLLHNHRVKTFHISSLTSLPTLLALQDTSKSISTTNRITSLVLSQAAVESHGGITVGLECSPVGFFAEDVFSIPDEKGRRWIPIRYLKIDFGSTIYGLAAPSENLVNTVKEKSVFVAKNSIELVRLFDEELIIQIKNLAEQYVDDLLGVVHKHLPFIEMTPDNKRLLLYNVSNEINHSTIRHFFHEIYDKFFVTGKTPKKIVGQLKTVAAFGADGDKYRAGILDDMKKLSPKYIRAYIDLCNKFIDENAKLFANLLTVGSDPTLYNFHYPSAINEIVANYIDVKKIWIAFHEIRPSFTAQTGAKLLLSLPSSGAKKNVVANLNEVKRKMENIFDDSIKTYSSIVTGSYKKTIVLDNSFMQIVEIVQTYLKQIQRLYEDREGNVQGFKQAFSEVVNESSGSVEYYKVAVFTFDVFQEVLSTKGIEIMLPDRSDLFSNLGHIHSSIEKTVNTDMREFLSSSVSK